MDKDTIKQKYLSLGLEIEEGEDAPGTIYPKHVHERTYLYTVSGSVDVFTEKSGWITLNPGEEFIVESGELHEAKVSEKGWGYIAAWNEEESKKFEEI